MYFDVAGIKYKKQSTVQVHGNLFHENIKWTLMSLATAIMLDRRVADRHKQKDGQTCWLVDACKTYRQADGKPFRRASFNTGRTI